MVWQARDIQFWHRAGERRSAKALKKITGEAADANHERGHVAQGESRVERCLHGRGDGGAHITHTVKTECMGTRQAKLVRCGL